MRTRKFDYFDTDDDRPKYSFQVYIGGDWCALIDNNHIVTFDTEEERDKEIKKYSKKR